MSKPLIIQYTNNIVDWYLDFVLKSEDTTIAKKQHKMSRTIYALIALNILGTMTAAIFVLRRLRRL